MNNSNFIFMVHAKFILAWILNNILGNNGWITQRMIEEKNFLRDDI